MRIGIPKEIKNNEYRVGLTPAGVRELCLHGHEVLVETQAGSGVGIDDAQYQAAGAVIGSSPDDIFFRAELIVKVKEPQPQECRQLQPGQTIFTYLHLAPDHQQAALLLESGVSAIAYETVTDDQGRLPLLAPMSEVAGRMSIQAGAHHLETPHGGSGLLLSGVPGVEPAHVLVLGGGVVGLNAARMALGFGADVAIVDKSLSRLKAIDELYGGRIKTLYATHEIIEHQLVAADLVIGAVLVPGASAPKLITREMLALAQPGSVLVDVSIDQGGCFETSHPTTHEHPTFEIDNITHYCVANMPGGVARTSTQALTHATLPYILELADNGTKKAILQDHNLANGLNVHAGSITCEAVAESLGYNYVPVEQAFHATRH